MPRACSAPAPKPAASRYRRASRRGSAAQVRRRRVPSRSPAALAAAARRHRSRLARSRGQRCAEGRGSVDACLPLAPRPPREAGGLRRAPAHAAAAPAAIRRRSSSSAPTVRPSACSTAWNGAAHKYGGAQGLHADERPLREPQGHLLPPVGPGLRQPSAKPMPLCSRCASQGGSCFVRNVAGDAPVQYRVALSRLPTSNSRQAIRTATPIST